MWTAWNVWLADDWLYRDDDDDRKRRYEWARVRMFAVSKLSGFRVLNTAKHIAWCKAGGNKWRTA